jgi:DNA-binding transcriptional LysR family regulator
VAVTAAIRAAVEGMEVAVGRAHLVAPDLAARRLVRLSKDTVRSPFSYWLIRPTGRSDRIVDLFSGWLVGFGSDLRPCGHRSWYRRSRFRGRARLDRPTDP